MLARRSLSVGTVAAYEHELRPPTGRRYVRRSLTRVDLESSALLRERRRPTALSRHASASANSAVSKPTVDASALGSVRRRLAGLMLLRARLVAPAKPAWRDRMFTLEGVQQLAEMVDHGCLFMVAEWRKQRALVCQMLGGNLIDDLDTFAGQLDEQSSAVLGVWYAPDEPCVLESGEAVSHCP